MKVAIVKLSSLGDVVHALPVAASLRVGLPGARLAWIVEVREAGVLSGHPALDEVIAVDTRRWRRARRPRDLVRAAGEVWRLARRLSAARFDVTLDLQGLWKSAVLARLTRAPVRLGFAASWCREPASARLHTRRVSPPPAAHHVVEQYLALLEPLGVRTRVLDFTLPVDPVAEAAVDDYLAGAGLKPRDRLVVLNPGAGRADKRWPAERFAELARRLADEGGARCLVVWGPGEEATARHIAAGAGPRTVLGPPTDLGALLAVLRRASVVVAADTGPLHLAAALGRPCVGLYGPTRAARNGPYGSGHRTLTAPDGRMTSIPAGAVAAAVLELLG
ncbi:MAG TPA: lipopolysaccharide heptosyltransferase I [Calidithermus sp.]|nr:lipopolysaccharide heptosyltransferase I [Calidithermus sp.]